MNVSKINSMSFKGYLTIQNKDEVHTFNTNNIKSVTNDKKLGGTVIEGKEDTSGVNSKLLIPYAFLSPRIVISAYNSACQSKKAEIVLRKGE